MSGKIPEQLTQSYPVKTSGTIPENLKDIIPQNISSEKISVFLNAIADGEITAQENNNLGLSDDTLRIINDRLKTQRETLEQAQQNQNAEQPTDSIGFEVNPEYSKKAREIADKLVENLKLPEGKQAIPEETEE